jgi:histidinol-phosphate aminotransferase
MGLLDYYRQFDDMDESEVNAALRERRAKEKALALEHVPVIDLSGTEWPYLPHAEVVGASVYQARGRLNGYPDREAIAIRRELAERHYVRLDQIVVGNGIAELLKTAADRLLSAGSELVTPWPSYGLYPAIAGRAGARLVEAPLVEGHADPGALLDAVSDRTRLVVICNPNDPTGTYLEAARLGDLVARLPAHVYVAVDEAYIQFQDAEPEDSVMRLVEAFPNLFVLRTFSKAYGLSGLRAGYVIGSPAAASFLTDLAPMLGVNALTQAAVLQALKIGDRDIAERRAMVIEQRARLREAIEDLPIEMSESQANFVWMRAEGESGDELAERLERSRVRVAPGRPLGDDRYIRAAIRDAGGTDRLIWALRELLGERERLPAGAV